MGLLGIAIGFYNMTKGFIEDDDELIEKGARRTLFGTTTLFIGDVFGASDAVGKVAEIFINSDA